MEILSSIYFAGIIYDLTKHAILITANVLKDTLKDWVLSDAKAEKLERLVQELDINDSMGEESIEHQITLSPELMTLLSNIKPKNNVSINQNHYGTGDNIAKIKFNE